MYASGGNHYGKSISLPPQKLIAMNKLFMLFLLIGFSKVASAQDKLKEGKITYEINYLNAEDLNDQVLAMLPKESTVYIKDGNSRMEQKAGFGSTIAITDAKTKETIVLMDMMGKKNAIKSTAEETQKEQEKNAGEYDVKITDETKKIAGYTCKKAIVTFKDSEKEPIEVWFTDEIASPSSGRVMFKGINGFLMEFVTEQKTGMGPLKMKFSCTKVEKVPVSDDLFKVPEGYTVMTKEELMKQFQQH
jgi:GLPGLI family protein